MTNFGAIADRVNSQAYKVTITNSTSGEYLFLQDVRMILAHTEFKEPTTSGGNIYYSGTPTNRLIGTVLYSKDMFIQANIGFNATLLTRANGEVPLITASIILTSAGGTASTFTYTAKLKVESVDVTKAAEGGVKIAVSYILTDDPALIT